MLVAAGSVESDTATFAVKVPGAFESAARRLRPARQGQRRPRRPPARRRRDPPHLRGLDRRGALQRPASRSRCRSPSASARTSSRRSTPPATSCVPRSPSGPRRCSAPSPSTSRWTSRATSSDMVGQLEGSVHHRDPDGDDGRAGDAGLPLGDPGRDLDPVLVPAQLRADVGLRPAGQQHGDVRPDPGRRHAGRRRHRRRRIRRQGDPGRHRADARLWRGRQADVLADRLVDGDDALRLPADAVLARHAGQVHGPAADHADLRPVGLADRRPDLRARARRRRRPDQPRAVAPRAAPAPPAARPVAERLPRGPRSAG